MEAPLVALETLTAVAAARVLRPYKCSILLLWSLILSSPFFPPIRAGLDSLCFSIALITELTSPSTYLLKVHVLLV
ncbi:hypothetical protein RSAG8_02325, partial [Rhizoctonia solani AG-8 WAC10335]